MCLFSIEIIRIFLNVSIKSSRITEGNQYCVKFPILVYEGIETGNAKGRIW